MGKRRQRAARPDASERWYTVYGPNAGAYQGWAAASLAAQGVAGGSCAAAPCESDAVRLVAEWRERQRLGFVGGSVGGARSHSQPEGAATTSGAAIDGPRPPHRGYASDASDADGSVGRRRSPRKRQRRRLADDGGSAPYGEEEAPAPAAEGAEGLPRWAAAAAAAGWRPPRPEEEGEGPGERQAPPSATAQAHAFLSTLSQPQPRPS